METRVSDSPALSEYQDHRSLHYYPSSVFTPGRHLFLNSKLNNSNDIRGHLSAEIVKDNVLETTSESEKETDIKKTKATLNTEQLLKARKSDYDSLIGTIFENSPKRYTSWDKEKHMIDKHKLNKLYPRKVSPQKLQEKEDSEDSILNYISSLKSKPNLLEKVPKTCEKSSEEILQLFSNESIRFHATRIENENLRKSNIDPMNLSTRSLRTNDIIKENYPLKPEQQERLMDNSGFFISKSNARERESLPRDLTKKTDTPYLTRTRDFSINSILEAGNAEFRGSRFSSPFSPKRSVASPNDVQGDDQPNTTGQSPRSKFFKAYKNLSKETQDKIKQEKSSYPKLPYYHNDLPEKSVILKPKAMMLRHSFNISSTENPFKKAFEYTDNSGESDNTSIRNRDFSNLNAIKLDTTSPPVFPYPIRNPQLDTRKRLKKLQKWQKSSSSYISHRRSSSIDSDQDGSISNELHKHLEKQHIVSNSMDVLSSVSRKDRTAILSEKPSSSKSILMEDVSETSEDDVSASRTPVVRIDRNESRLHETVTNDRLKTDNKSDRSTSKRVGEHRSPQIVSDVPVKLLNNLLPDNLLRRSTRLNTSTKCSDNLISELETLKTSRTRSSTRNSKSTSVGKRANTVIDNSSSELEEAVVAAEMKDATPAPQTRLQSSPSSGKRTDNKITRQTSVRMSAMQNSDESNVEDSKNTSLRQSSLTRSQSQRGSLVEGSRKDVSKDDVSIVKTPVVATMKTNELSEVMIDDPSDKTTKKLDRSTSRKRVSEQNVHKKVRLTRSNPSSKSATPKITNDVPPKLLRQSLRLNRSTEHSDNLILESEPGMRNAPRTRSSIGKTNTRDRTMEDFFKVKRSSPGKKQTTSNEPHSVPSEIFKDTRKMQQIKEQVETMKSREIAAMKMHADKTGKKQSASNVKASNVVSKKAVKKKKLPAAPAKKVHPAYLVNGKVYKAPKLVRPKSWVTDRLYKFLWKRMEPNYQLSMRIRSEKFIEELSKVVTLISRRKKYNNYKDELEALMKEMARLQIINTRNDFYTFCHDFLPYEFRVKVTPILMPGNGSTIPYDPEKLHTFLLHE